MGMSNTSIPTNASAVTPSDSADASGLALWVGGAGNISIITAGGQTVTLSGVQAGTLIPLEFSRVRSTGTTATNIVRMW